MNKKNFQISVDRALDLYQRFTDAVSVRDQASRLYYACYHTAIAAVELKADYETLRKAENTSYHVALQTIYPRYYGKPTPNNKSKTQIVTYKVKSALQTWRDIRVVADYVVFGEHFDKDEISRTLKQINNMTNFVKDHLRYFAESHSQQLTDEQTAEIGKVAPPTNEEKFPA